MSENNKEEKIKELKGQLANLSGGEEIDQFKAGIDEDVDRVDHHSGSNHEQEMRNP